MGVLSGGDEGAAKAFAAPALGSPGWPGSPLALAGFCGGPVFGGGVLNCAVCGVCSVSVSARVSGELGDVSGVFGLLGRQPAIGLPGL